MSESTEVIQELLQALGLDAGYRTDSLSLLETGGSRYLRDLKLNFTSTLTSQHLTEKECALIGLATAVNNTNKPLIRYFTRYAEEKGASPEETGEAAACASLLASNNVFTVSGILPKKEKYSQIPARIRMQLMMKPVTGKEFFELLSLAISAVNGCEMCVNAHEDSLIKLSTSEERIFDAVRVASLVTATGKVVF